MLWRGKKESGIKRGEKSLFFPRRRSRRPCLLFCLMMIYDFAIHPLQRRIKYSLGESTSSSFTSRLLDHYNLLHAKYTRGKQENIFFIIISKRGADERVFLFSTVLSNLPNFTLHLTLSRKKYKYMKASNWKTGETEYFFFWKKS